ncbi:MAG: bifunctional diaminohydroxyphosphoribosylaminopyrimidine deaminase/5-amino-6-(5-phosphoribosylamino)uracil reductase RibD [Bacteroidetes bacterium]|nr:bifunctional diaminohydroxyphosphoribosylaminopyrimidine deaminase/5-amino-6-(5-phosphoribosylamino)uracil reductase RibD [Bacteroidota bacterium]
MLSREELFMQHCLQLAQLGAGKVAPNPLVGAVLVVDDKIIAEGYHAVFGGPHAEPAAIKQVQDKELLKRAELYVNLEPCAHQGKTPPCADLIIESGIPKVNIGMKDPFEKVAGAGIQKLKDAGIDVVCGILEKEAAWLNRRFLHWVNYQEPYIILKWAQTMSGYLAPDPKRMSSEEFAVQRHITGLIVQKLVHKWRGEEAAILVGNGTVALDNPHLNTRAWPGKNPVRMVVDRNLKLNSNFAIFDGKQETWIINSRKEGIENGIRYISFPENEDWIPYLKKAMYSAGLQSLIVEGGRQILTHFINNSAWNEAQVFYTPKHFDGGVAAPLIGGILREEFSLDNSHFKLYTPW